MLSIKNHKARLENQGNGTGKMQFPYENTTSVHSLTPKGFYEMMSISAVSCLSQDGFLELT